MNKKSEEYKWQWKKLFAQARYSSTQFFPERHKTQMLCGSRDSPFLLEGYLIEVIFLVVFSFFLVFFFLFSLFAFFLLFFRVVLQSVGHLLPTPLIFQSFFYLSTSLVYAFSCLVWFSSLRCPFAPNTVYPVRFCERLESEPCSPKIQIASRNGSHCNPTCTTFLFFRFVSFCLREVFQDIFFLFFFRSPEIEAPIITAVGLSKIISRHNSFYLYMLRRSRRSPFVTAARLSKIISSRVHFILLFLALWLLHFTLFTLFAPKFYPCVLRIYWRCPCSVCLSHVYGFVFCRPHDLFFFYFIFVIVCVYLFVKF